MVFSLNLQETIEMQNNFSDYLALFNHTEFFSELCRASNAKNSCIANFGLKRTPVLLEKDEVGFLNSLENCDRKKKLF